MRRAAPLLAVFLLLIPVAAAQPPETPPGLERQQDDTAEEETPTGAVTASPPWSGDRPSTLKLVGLTTVIVLSIVGAAAFGYHRYRDDSPVEVQTDAERVLALLEEIDGTVTQPDIREETGWSASKVSRVTGELEDRGEIEKLQLGRENILRRT